MKISASVYSNKTKSLTQLVQELDKHFIDYFHIDSNDDLNVFNDIKSIQTISQTPIDLHVISTRINEFCSEIKKLNISHVSFQYEQIGNHKIEPNIAPNIGLALMNDTPIEVFEPYKDMCNYVLLMTTTPGQSGGVFNKHTFNKIRDFNKKYPNKQIQVDGGVNAEVSFILRNMGVHCAVVGSYLFNTEWVGAALLSLYRETPSTHFTIQDFMIGKEDLPILPLKNLSIKNILLAIEKYKMAFVLIEDEQKFIGIISNADVRKGLINNIENFANINPETLINKHPLYIYQNQSIQELLETIKQFNFPVQYLPVLNNKEELTGAITFNQLIKGEI